MKRKTRGSGRGALSPPDFSTARRPEKETVGLPIDRPTVWAFLIPRISGIVQLDLEVQDGVDSQHQLAVAISVLEGPPGCVTVEPVPANFGPDHQVRLR